MSQRRILHSQTQQKVRRKSLVSRALHRHGAVDFFNTLAGPFRALTDALMPDHRERLYPPTVTLSMFISQVLNADHSCQRVVNEWAVMRHAEGLPPQSVRTGGYCRARQRLPVEMIRALARATGGWLATSTPAPWLWHGRVVKLIDGTSVSMPDTPSNQARYPQLNSQAAGVGFPLSRLVAVICLSTGAVVDAAMGPYEGEGSGEHGLTRDLLGAMATGDVVLGDALYGSYWLIAALQSAGVDAVFAQHAGRRTDFRRGQRLGKHDHVVTWKKPRQVPSWMSEEAYAAYPSTLTMREVRCGHRVLTTTLLDVRQVSRCELGDLYAKRWHIELDLRNIKDTLGMDVLRCQSPDMVEKEVWTYLLAYNLIRVLMAESAKMTGSHPRELSFKHTVQITLCWLMLCRTRRRRSDLDGLYKTIAQCRVGKRPGRVEPRARKRRPKAFPLLMVPRAVAQQKIRKSNNIASRK
jgi:Transposase DDE domain